ncbi:similar to Saccharomyces cerevisiae YGR071C Putative protein of unknown function [Maudiozyma saulgeensis]|uniref:BED-type domain-containing protein n=1 Tax=Maudiozyma saulgeensis TaxID=1789683 RepID=A0A1X7RAG7_9SACH|nr:similar to Saccharomyces cerevisiae YGR071C Putative protein of unknown function [Kazachstania saulgeensis]
MEVSELTDAGLILPPVLQRNRVNQPENNITTTTASTKNSKKRSKAADSIERRSHKKLVRNIKVPEQLQHEVIEDDEGNRWIPVHLIHRKKGEFWTHFLAFRNDAHDVKCKHCGNIFHRLNLETRRPVNTEIIDHLINIHGIDKNTSFYEFGNDGLDDLQDNLDQETDTHESTINNSITNIITTATANAMNNTNISNDNINEKTTRRIDENDIAAAIEASKLEAASKKRRKILKSKKTNNFPITQLLAVIIASENLPLQFLDDSAVQMLLGRASNADIPSMFDIMDTIKSTSRQIDSIVQRTASRNALDTQLIIDKMQLSSAKESADDELVRIIKRHLIEVSKMNFFSLTYNVWSKSVSILTLQFNDPLSQSIKSLPLAVDLGDPLSKDMGIVTCRTQLLKIIKRIPSLAKSIVAITLPNERRLTISNSENYDFLKVVNNNIPMNQFHNCFVTFLQDIISPLFDDKSDEDEIIENQPNSTNDTSNNNNNNNNMFTDIDRDNQTLDNVINIADTNPSANTVFDRINKIYDSIRSNPWELSRFKDLASNILENDNNNPMIYFERQRFSTATLALERFIKLESAITTIQQSLPGIEKFNKTDFLIMSTLHDFLKSFNKIVLYYVSGPATGGIYTLLALFAIEKHLVDSISAVRLGPVMASMKKVLNTIKRTKRLLIKDDMILVSMFMCPLALFEREILEYTFDSTSLSDIVQMVSQAILNCLKPFVDLQEIDSSATFNEMSRNDGGDTPQNNNNNDDDDDETADEDNNDATIGSIDEHATSEPPVEPPRTEPRRGETTALQTRIFHLLLQMIQTDLYEYLTTVNAIIPKSYLSFCERSGYVTEHGVVWNHQDTPDEDVHGITKPVPKKNPVNFMDQLLDIKMPVCDAFWQQYLYGQGNVVTKLLMQIIKTQASSSIRQNYSFLKDFKSQLGEEFFEDVIKIKLFNDQFSVGKIDFDMDTLPSACEYS